MMTAFSVIAIQSAFSMFIFSLLAVRYLLPALRKEKLQSAIVPLLWINTFRYLPLILFAPGQVAAAIPVAVSTSIAYGDFVAALLVLTAVLFISFKRRGGILLTWVFLVTGSAEALYGVYCAITSEAYKYPLGFSWVLVTFFVPMIFVSEGLLLHQLITNKNM